MKKILWVLCLGIFLLFPVWGPVTWAAEETAPAAESGKEADKENSEWWDEFDQDSDWGALEADKQPEPEPAEESFNQTEEPKKRVKDTRPVPAAVKK